MRTESPGPINNKDDGQQAPVVKLHHVAIQVPDLAKARAFYVDLLGLPLLRTQDHALWVQAGDAIVMLEKCDAPPAPVGDWKSALPGPFCIAFAVDIAGRTGLRQRLLQAGVVVDHESRYTTYIRDPFGARLGFSHHPTAEPDGTES